MAEDLKSLHIADLHARAAGLGIEGYRKLGRDELAREISERGGGTPGAEPDPDEVVVEGTLVTSDADQAVEVDAEGPLEPDEATEEVVGSLDILPQRYGFLRLRGLEADPGDVYVSASQIRRCELRPGDEVAGPAREPRRGERHRALVHVDRVNGREPQAGERPDFDELSAIAPEQRVRFDGEGATVLARAIDLLSPLALGQRVLVRAAPRSGRTTLLRGMATALAQAPEVSLIVLLVDERPEEATVWREAVPEAQFAIATADMAPGDQLRLAEMALKRAQRQAETGGNAILLVDSLSRLDYAAGDIAPVKSLFGSGRNLAGAGSLTVIATTLADAADGGAAERAVATTENALITLDPELAAAGVHPALVPGECRVSNEETLRDPDELEGVRRLRSVLAELTPQEAARKLGELIEGTPTNADLLRSH